jgi:predicted metal-binding membrane protein
MESQQTAPGWVRQTLIEDWGWAWGGIAITWGLLLWSGQSQSHSMHHHPIALLSQLAYSLSAWETMLIAMMLPSVLPIAQLFRRVSQDQSDRLQAQGAFLLGYLIVWTGFAVLAVLAEMTWNQIAPSRLPPILFPLLSIGVGLFQFTPLKQNCLKGCRSAATFIAQHYDRGWKSGLNLGIQHGLYCLGCCIALMLEMVVLGVHNLQWMLLFTAIMTLERLWKYGEQFAIWVGVLLIVVGFAGIAIITL